MFGKSKKCDCGPDCKCGCQEGKECTCGGSCKNSCKCKAVGVVLITFGIALAGFFPGHYYYKAKMMNNYVTVKGLAEMDVRADLAVWDLKYVVTNNDLLTAQKEMQRQLNVILAFLKSKGFATQDINVGRVDTNDLMTNPYGDKNNISSRYILSQTIKVRSQNVDLVDKSLSSVGDLISKGIIFDGQSYGSPVSYVFTKLNEIKPTMLQDATKNAREAAAEFAKSSDSKVGKIRRAQQGVFSILPREQTQNAMESQQIDKQVRVVSTIEYYLD